jgi:dihydroorotate dehydrogenase (NAD+) catalytic subunit
MMLQQRLLGTEFQNPVLLAAGTCGFGEELSEVVELDRLGGLVTKSVTLEPRQGNPAPRVAEFRAGMMNSIGLANPGARAVRESRLPWLRDRIRRARVLVSVAGHSVDEFVQVVKILDDADGFVGFELNLSCPNDARRGGLPFALDPDEAGRVMAAVRRVTERPLVAKLAPNTPDFGPVVSRLEDAGANAFTLVNTLPGLVLDPDTGAPALGGGAGGVSGPALRAVGVHAVWRVRPLTALPLLGVGGVSSGQDAAQYLLAGASLVQMGTASFWDPRAAERVIKWLHDYVDRKRVPSLRHLVGSGVPGWEYEVIESGGTARGVTDEPGIERRTEAKLGSSHEERGRSG